MSEFGKSILRLSNMVSTLKIIKIFIDSLCEEKNPPKQLLTLQELIDDTFKKDEELENR